HFERNLACQPLEAANHYAMPVARRHEVDQADSTRVTDEFGRENERVAFVLLLHLTNRNGRPDRPASVLVVADQSREARVRIEARGAQPIDRTGFGHERYGLGITYHSVIFDSRRHLSSSDQA